MREDLRMHLPRFEPFARLRPVALLGSVQVRAQGARSVAPCPRPAPYAAAVASGVGERLVLAWRSGTDVVEAVYAEGRVQLRVTTAGRTTTHRSRRLSRLPAPATEVALTLTGIHLTVLTRGADEEWVARARVDVSDRVDTRDEAWLAGLEVLHEGTVTSLAAGGFGQVGLRDLRVVSHPDGTPYRLGDGRAVLTATSAGPGFFDTAHTSVWAFDPDASALEHLSDLYFRRPDRPGVFGDHATHLVRISTGSTAEPRWLVATSTWGDFDAKRPGASVAVTLARTDADLLQGEHVLDTEPLALPTEGFTSVGVWDPHLVQTRLEDGRSGWLVGYVSARRFFRFHPVVASGPSLDRLSVRGVDSSRRATEGTTLHRVAPRLDPPTPQPPEQEWVVLASDGPDGRRGQRRRYPVFDLAMTEIGTVEAPYPTNIPWPTLLPVPATDSGRGQGEQLVMIGFDGTGWGGSTATRRSLLGYGTHGDVVIGRSAAGWDGDAGSVRGEA